MATNKEKVYTLQSTEINTEKNRPNFPKIKNLALWDHLCCKKKQHQWVKFFSFKFLAFLYSVLLKMLKHPNLNKQEKHLKFHAHMLNNACPNINKHQNFAFINLDFNGLRRFSILLLFVRQNFDVAFRNFRVFCYF
jgi:hypothetical protein